MIRRLGCHFLSRAKLDHHQPLPGVHLLCHRSRLAAGQATLRCLGSLRPPPPMSWGQSGRHSGGGGGHEQTREARMLGISFGYGAERCNVPWNNPPAPDVIRTRHDSRRAHAAGASLRWIGSGTGKHPMSTQSSQIQALAGLKSQQDCHPRLALALVASCLFYWGSRKTKNILKQARTQIPPLPGDWEVARWWGGGTQTSIGELAEWKWCLPGWKPDGGGRGRDINEMWDSM